MFTASLPALPPLSTRFKSNAAWITGQSFTCPPVWHEAMKPRGTLVRYTKHLGSRAIPLKELLQPITLIVAECQHGIKRLVCSDADHVREIEVKLEVMRFITDMT